MPKLLMLQGLPGSGKSTLAAELVSQGWVEVNKDAIRKELTSKGWRWDYKKEEDVIIERDIQIAYYLAGGKNVVSSDTNFGRKHKVRLSEIARNHHAEFEIKRLDTDVEACVQRDALRVDGRVGEKVIRDMAAKYLGVSRKLEDFDIQPVVQDMSRPHAIICDLDGTLALYEKKGHRGHYDASNCHLDEVCDPVRNLLRIYDTRDYHIIYVSGREDIYKAQTEQFLAINDCPYDGYLFMRKAKDYRKDFIVKYEIFNQYIQDKFYVEAVIDDRPQVLRMWRKLGLFTFAVGPGEEF